MYLVKVPPLEEMPSHRHERLSLLGHSFADAWLKEQVALVILADDETGETIFVASAAADRELPAWRRNLLVKNALEANPGETLVREKVERAVLVVVEVLSKAQDEARDALRRDRLVGLAVAGVVIAGLATVLLARRQPRGG